MLCKAIREEKSKEISAILTYTHSLISQMVGTNRNKDNKVNMTPADENRLAKLFYIAEPQQVGNRNFILYYILYGVYF
jgi:hypothetical protein